MQTPADILTKRFGQLADNAALVGDYTAYALDIDEELQQKFVSIPYEEIEAVEIINRQDNEDDPTLQAGSGPEAIRANAGDNPAWLYNSAVHALAMWQHLSRLQERKAEEEKLAKRPEPGVYAGNGGDFTVIVTGDRRVLVIQSNGYGVKDYTEDWDAFLHKSWKLQRIDIHDGTIEGVGTPTPGK